MGNVTDALKQAGVKVPPLNKRVWLWLHDHPGKTYREVAVGIKEDPGEVSGTLSALVKRDMVVGVAMPMRGSNRSITQYTTKGRTYELLPIKKPGAVPVEVAPEPVKPPKLAPEALAASLLDTMTVREAHAMYLALREMFGGTTS